MIFLSDLKPDSLPYQDYMEHVRNHPELKKAYDEGKPIKIAESLDNAELAYPD